MGLLDSLFGKQKSAPARDPDKFRLSEQELAAIAERATKAVPERASLPGSDPELLARIGEQVRARLEATPAAAKVPATNLDMYVVRDFLSAEECAELIELIDADVKPSTSLRAPGAPLRRTSETCRLSAAEPLVIRIEERLAELFGIPTSQGETLQGQRYFAGQQFKLHNDYFAAGQVYSETVAQEGGQRTWTAMVFLDQPAAGGRTSFPKASVEVTPRTGALLTWNNLDAQGLPNLYSHHEGTAVEAGVKHVLTKWFREREWHSSAASDALRR